MTYIVTLVASKEPLSISHLSGAESLLEEGGVTIDGKPRWLKKHKAADIPVSGKPDMAQIKRLRTFLAEDKIDLFVVPSGAPAKKLLLADMDSTIVTGETIDEIAARAGLADKIAPITARAMRGELNFEEALRARVALLEGLDAGVLQTVLGEMRLSPGASDLVRHLNQGGATCVLVSGGFTCFTGAIARQAGFQHHHGNTLEMENGRLTGRVTAPILGKEAKLAYLDEYQARLNLARAEVMAIGDGANDLPMLLAAGLGIGFHPKPLLLESLENCIIHGDLSAALYALGYGAK